MFVTMASKQVRLIRMGTMGLEIFLIRYVCDFPQIGEYLNYCLEHNSKSVRIITGLRHHRGTVPGSFWGHSSRLWQPGLWSVWESWSLVANSGTQSERRGLLDAPGCDRQLRANLFTD